MTPEVAEKIAATLRTVSVQSLSGRWIAANIETGEVAGETFSEGDRVPLQHPWYLFAIKPVSAETLLARFES